MVTRQFKLTIQSGRPLDWCSAHCDRYIVRGDPQLSRTCLGAHYLQETLEDQTIDGNGKTGQKLSELDEVDYFHEFMEYSDILNANYEA